MRLHVYYHDGEIEDAPPRDEIAHPANFVVQELDEIEEPTASLLRASLGEILAAIVKAEVFDDASLRAPRLALVREPVLREDPTQALRFAQRSGDSNVPTLDFADPAVRRNTLVLVGTAKSRVARNNTDGPP